MTATSPRPEMERAASTRPLVVLGAGVMGTGITTLATCRGVPVVLIDPDDERLGSAPSRIAYLQRHAQLAGALSPDAEMAEVDYRQQVTDDEGFCAVIEAVTEDGAVKVKALGSISRFVFSGTPIITNTSGIPIDELAGCVSDPSALLGIHFMNPPYLINTVELVIGSRTSTETMDRVSDLLSRLGRRYIAVRDSPGFVTSRLLHPMINAAASLVGQGIAAAEDIDALMENCIGFATGPLRTADLIGLDNLVDSLTAMDERLHDDSCRPCEELLHKVRDGHLGQKSGRGFYEYGGWR